MKRLNIAALCLIAVGAASSATIAYGALIPGTFRGYVTSFETVTAPNTYSNALGTLPNRSLSGYAGWFVSYPTSADDGCNVGSNYLSCIYACGGYNYVAIRFSGGSISPQFDNLSGANDGDCQLGDAEYSWGHGVTTGYVEALDVGLPPSGNLLYEGIQLNFDAPAVPASAPWLVDSNFWSGSGSFWYTEYAGNGGANGDATVIAGYQGTFDVVPTPEPATLGLMCAGLALTAVAGMASKIRRTRLGRSG